MDDTDLGRTALHEAAENGDVIVASHLLDGGADVNARSAEGRTPLHDAIEFGHADVVNLLLERGAEVDICAAAILGRTERVLELLSSDPALANDRSTQLSPLAWAAFGNQVETAALLIEKGARMDDGELHCAAMAGHVQVGRLLIDKGAPVGEACGSEKVTPLHQAAAMEYTTDSTTFVEMLLEAGADLNARTAGGLTALDVAKAGLARQQAALEAEERVWIRDYEKLIGVLER
jgi:ankyrin repeat protein